MIKFCIIFYLMTNIVLGKTSENSESDDQPIDESKVIDDDDQTVKGLINSLNLNEKVEIDSKNPKLKELKEKIEEMLKKKKEEMKEEEKKKNDAKVVNLKPKNEQNCKEVDEDKKEAADSEAKSDKN